MANHGGRRSTGPDNSSLILGILIGMVLGLVVAGGVAWHLSKRPNNFTGKDEHATVPATAPAPAATAASARNHAVANPPKPVQPASAVDDTRQKFEFYKILTDKESTPPKAATHTPSGTGTGAPPKTASAGTYLLQAGSFTNQGDAENMKAKLALLGLEANVQVADVPGKGTRYRVRLGPYRTTEEVSKANTTLKQNGINDATQVRSQ